MAGSPSQIVSRRYAAPTPVRQILNRRHWLPSSCRDNIQALWKTQGFAETEKSVHDSVVVVKTLQAAVAEMRSRRKREESLGYEEVGGTPRAELLAQAPTPVTFSSTNH